MWLDRAKKPRSEAREARAVPMRGSAVRARVDRQGVDLARHQIAERFVDPAVPGDWRQAGERGRDDSDPEVTAAAGCTGVSDVKVALVDDRELAGGERGG